MDLYLCLPYRKANTIIIKADLYSESNITKCKIVFDTGAARTALRKSLLVRAGYNVFDDSKTIKQTGAGIVQLKTCMINRFDIGGVFKLNNLKVDVLDAPGLIVDGVLGMDFISQVNCLLDKTTRTLTISTKPWREFI